MTMSKSIFGLSFFRIYADIDDDMVQARANKKNVESVEPSVVKDSGMKDSVMKESTGWSC